VIGKIVGNYQILNELARGGTSVLYRAQHLHSAREVVLKTFGLSSFSSSAQIHLRARFRREAFIQSQLNHPNIVRTYEFFTIGENHFLATEYVPGMSLRELLAKEGPPSPAQALYLFKQALTALEYAHSLCYVDESDINHTGALHRGLKPSNLLLDVKGRLKISDFGLGKVLGDGGLVGATQNRHSAGGVDYMAPEQARGGEIDRRSDLYSLGVTMFEMLTGRFPFTRSEAGALVEGVDRRLEHEPISILEYQPSLPPSLAAIVMRSLHKSPGDRFQTATEFLDALRLCEQQAAPSLSSRIYVERDRSEPVIDRRGYVEPAPGAAQIYTTAEIPVENLRSAARTTSARTARLESFALADLGQFFSNVKTLASSRARLSMNGNATLAAAALTLVLISGVTIAYLIGRRIFSADFSGANQPSDANALATGGRGKPTALEEADLYEREEQYAEAIKIYESFIAKNPESAATAETRLLQLKQLEGSLTAAEAAMTAGRYKVAVQRYGLAIRLNPDSQRAKVGFSRALSKLPDAGGQGSKSRPKPRPQNPAPQALPEKPLESAEQSQLDKSSSNESPSRRNLRDGAKAEDPNLQP
jgi:serine/threonine protein kinase